MKRPGRYAVRLLVVAGIITAVIGLGYLWRISPLASIIADGRGDGGGRFRPDRGPLRGDGAAFSLGNIGDLFTTIAIGVGALSAVIVIDRWRRQRRPVRPARGSGADSRPS